MKNRDTEFEFWMKELDRHFIGTFSLSIHDVEDQPFRDYFEDGLSTQEAIEIIAEEIGLKV